MNKAFGTALDTFQAGNDVHVRASFAVLDQQNGVVFAPDNPDSTVLVLETSLGYSDTVQSIRGRLIEILRTVVYRGIAIDAVIWLDDKGLV